MTARHFNMLMRTVGHRALMRGMFTALWDAHEIRIRILNPCW